MGSFGGLSLARSTSAPMVEVRREQANCINGSEVVLRGVGAGPFTPRYWQAGTLNWVPDAQEPLLEPKPGKMRNIYAPSVVEMPEGWRLFYGAWDGVPTGNDRIYSADSKDLVTFRNRHTVIEHGAFTHVCNVNALRHVDGSYSMVATACPDRLGLNKPIFFTSPDGKTWNGSPEPYVAQERDLADVVGYPQYANADINGMNVLLREDGAYRLYFGDFKQFRGVYRATSRDGRKYRYEGKVLDGQFAVNDVKRLRAEGADWYLMGLHMNGDRLWYSLSQNGLDFPPTQELFRQRTAADRYIVALGWVVRGEPDAPGWQVLGVLYGAGADPGLASNRIFARWLQRRAVFVAEDGTRLEATAARGPDAQVFTLGERKQLRGRFEIYAEDGRTLLGRSKPLLITPGDIHSLSPGGFGRKI